MDYKSFNAHLYIGNSNLVEVIGLRNAITRAYINDATASFSVTRNGNPISGGSDVPMSYVNGSNGRYVGVLADTADLTRANHVVVITVDAGSNADAVWHIKVKPSLRDA